MAAKGRKILRFAQDDMVILPRKITGASGHRPYKRCTLNPNLQLCKQFLDMGAGIAQAALEEAGLAAAPGA